MAECDFYFPNPPIHCPISGAVIREWTGTGGPCLGLVWKEKQGKPELDRLESQDQATAEELKARRLTDGIRIVAYSPEGFDGKLRLTAHVFVEDGVWVNSEICEVYDEGAKKLYYSTDE